MWNFFLDHKRFTYLLIVALTGFGVFSVFSIPKESAPEVQVPVGVVTTILPGAPAVDVESLVTNEIERGLKGTLENVKKVTSTSREGVSSVVVEFEANADIDQSISKLRDQVETLIGDLPNEAERPLVAEVNFVDQPIFTVALGAPLTPEAFTDLATVVEDRIEGVTGVSRVETAGVRDREVSVLVSEASLLQFNLSITDIITAVRTANTVLPVGQIISDEVTYNVVFEGDIATIADIADLPVTERNGQPVYVRDVATVVLGLAPATNFSRLSVAQDPSTDSIVLSVYKRRGGDVTRLSDAIKAEITAMQDDGTLANVDVYVVQDAGELIKKDLTNLTNSGLQTILLVVVVLVLTIGWREGLLAGFGIPLSFTIGFIGLYLSGNTINFISLFALILGIGVLVDSGIVIVEAINKRIKDDPALPKIEAARAAVREFAAPLISGTLTTVAMFAGLFIVSGVTGQFIAAIPFTLIFVMFASLLVALGFLPLLASVFLVRRETSVLDEKQERFSHIVESWYRFVITRIIQSSRLKRRFVYGLVAGLVASILLIPLGLVKVVFFEQTDVDEIYVEVTLPQGSTKERTDLVVRQVEELLYEEDIITAFSTTVGAGNAFSGGGAGERLANIYIALDQDRTITSTQFVEELRATLLQVTGADIAVTQPSSGPPAGKPIGVKIFGSDDSLLREAADKVSLALGSVEGVINITTDTNTNSTEFVFELDKAKAAALGLNPAIISSTLRSAVFGSTATEITTAKEAIEVVVRLNLSDDANADPSGANRAYIETLENLLIATPKGEQVPLSSLITTSLRESSTAILHEDGLRVVTVSADITADSNVYELNAEINDLLTTNDILPAGTNFALGGQNEDADQAFIELFLALVVGVVLMIGVLVLQFDSFRHTAYVLSILPFSLIGILVGLAITGSALSFPSIMGFIALCGIIVNNSILLIDMMNQERKRLGDEHLQSIVIEASVSRLRAIILTSLTTILGMVPLLFTDETWIPLATAIIFGLTFSVVITLILVPIIYSKWPGTVRT